VKRDSCILFLPHRLGRLACYIEDMNLWNTKIGRFSYRVFGQSVYIITGALFVTGA